MFFKKTKKISDYIANDIKAINDFIESYEPDTSLNDIKPFKPFRKHIGKTFIQSFEMDMEKSDDIY